MDPNIPPAAGVLAPNALVPAPNPVVAPVAPNPVAGVGCGVAPNPPNPVAGLPNVLVPVAAPKLPGAGAVLVAKKNKPVINGER